MGKKFYDYKELLSLLKNEYGIDSSILSKLTQIPRDFIENPATSSLADIDSGAAAKQNYLGGIMAYIRSGFSMNEDAYVKEHMEAMECLFHIERKAMAKYMNLDESKVTEFMQHPENLSPEEKYQIAVRFLSFEWMLTKNPNGMI